MKSINKLERLKSYLHEIDYDLETGKIKNRSEFKSSGGYLTVKIKGESFAVHQVIAVAGGLDIYGLTVNHIDGNKFNNSFHNLEAITNAENLKHAHRMGLVGPRGKAKKKVK